MNQSIYKDTHVSKEDVIVEQLSINFNNDKAHCKVSCSEQKITLQCGLRVDEDFSSGGGSAISVYGLLVEYSE